MTYAVIVKQDPPYDDMDPDYEVHLFTDEEVATKWVMSQPVQQGIAYHMLEPIVAPSG